MDKIYGLLGRKLSHSYSAAIHAEFGCKAYGLIELEPEELKTFLSRSDIGGLNVTIPYKIDAAKYCELSENAKLIGAVNTIVRHGHFQRLPKALKEAAELRLNYPDASLQELADMADIKKSGMNHRLTRLIEYAQDLENGLI